MSNEAHLRSELAKVRAKLEATKKDPKSKTYRDLVNRAWKLLNELSDRSRMDFLKRCLKAMGSKDALEFNLVRNLAREGDYIGALEEAQKIGRVRRGAAEERKKNQEEIRKQNLLTSNNANQNNSNLLSGLRPLSPSNALRLTGPSTPVKTLTQTPARSQARVPVKTLTARSPLQLKTKLIVPKPLYDPEVAKFQLFVLRWNQFAKLTGASLVSLGPTNVDGIEGRYTKNARRLLGKEYQKYVEYYKNPNNRNKKFLDFFNEVIKIPMDDLQGVQLGYTYRDVEGLTQDPNMDEIRTPEGYYDEAEEEVPATYTVPSEASSIYRYNSDATPRLNGYPLLEYPLNLDWYNYELNKMYNSYKKGGLIPKALRGFNFSTDGYKMEPWYYTKYGLLGIRGLGNGAIGDFELQFRNDYRKLHGNESLDDSDYKEDMYGAFHLYMDKYYGDSGGMVLGTETDTGWNPWKGLVKLFRPRYKRGYLWEPVRTDDKNGEWVKDTEKLDAYKKAHSPQNSSKNTTSKSSTSKGYSTYKRGGKLIPKHFNK